MFDRFAVMQIARNYFVLFALLGLPVAAFPQSITLSVGSSAGTAGGTVSVPINLTSSSGAQTAALQWTFSFSSDITGVTVVNGPSATNAGKSVDCSGNICLIYGLNTNIMADGTVATAIFQIASNPSTTTIPVQLTGVVAATALGTSIPATGGSGIISAPTPLAQSASLSCAPSTLGGNSSSLCTVFLSQAVTSATAIPLSSNNALVSVPGSVSVQASQSSATFSATTGTVAASQSATLTAAFGAGTAQTSVSVIPGLTFIGSMPHLAAESGWTTTFTLVNKSSAPVEMVANLFADDGTALTLPLTFPQQPSTSPLPGASIDQTLAANASLIIEASGPASVPYVEGSAQIAAAGAVGAVGAADGFAIFHFDPSEQEAVVPLETRNASSYIIPFDNTNGVLTALALENISTQSATIPVVLRDDMGNQIGTETIALNGDGHISFVLSTQYSVTANIRGTVEFDTPSGGQISVLGIRYTPLGTLTTIPALANVGTTGGLMAHLAWGGGWETTFVLVNTGTSAAQAQLSLFDDYGNPLLLPLTFPQVSGSPSLVASSISQSVGANASLWVQSAGALTDPLLTGSAQLTTTGNIGGFAIFRYNPNGQEAVVPLESRGASAYLLAFDNTNGTATGVAINAISTQAVDVPVVIRDDTGALIGTGSIPLAANGHSSQMLATLFPATAGVRGTLEFDAPAGAQIGVLGIRSPPALTLTTLPPLAK